MKKQPGMVALKDILSARQMVCVQRIAQGRGSTAEKIAALKEYFQTIKGDLAAKEIDPGYLSHAIAYALNL